MKMNMEHWWSDCMGEHEYCENTVPPAFSPPQIWEAGHWPPEQHHSGSGVVLPTVLRNEQMHFNRFSSNAEREDRNNFENLGAVRRPLQMWNGIWSVNLMDTAFWLTSDLLTHSLTYLLTYWLTYLLTYLLTYCLTYLLTHSLTHSLTL